MIERRKYQDGRIGYNSGSDKPNGSKPPWGEVPFDLDKWLQELDPGGWQDEDDKPNGKKVSAEKKEGIMRVASERGGREYLMMMLTRYYSPRDLYYKTIKELDQMLQMHITESGGLI